jgi:hypothetical protein
MEASIWHNAAAPMRASACLSARPSALELELELVLKLKLKHVSPLAAL